MKRRLRDYELPYNSYFLKKQFKWDGVTFNFLILNCDICFSLLIFILTIFLNIAV
jgi:hypothetical protein